MSVRSLGQWDEGEGKERKKRVFTCISTLGTRCRRDKKDSRGFFSSFYFILFARECKSLICSWSVFRLRALKSLSFSHPKCGRHATRFKGEKKDIDARRLGGDTIFFRSIRHSVPGIPGGRSEWDFYLSPLKPLRKCCEGAFAKFLSSPSHPTSTGFSLFPPADEIRTCFSELFFFLSLRSSFKKKTFEYTGTYGAFSSLLFGSTNISTFCVRALLLLCRRRRRRRRRRVAQTVIG